MTSTASHSPPMAGSPPRALMAWSGSMTATSSRLFLRGRPPAGINPSGSPSAPTAPRWRSATRMWPAVDLFDGHSLAPLPRPNVDGLGNGSLSEVMWSQDGKTLYAGGGYRVACKPCWPGPMRVAANGALCRPGAIQSRALRRCRMAVSWLRRMDPFIAVLEPDGRPRWAHASPKADFRDQRDVLAVSADGAMVDFGFEQWGKSPLRFDLRARKLSRDPPADNQTIRAKQSGLAIEGWQNGSPRPLMASRSS